MAPGMLPPDQLVVVVQVESVVPTHVSLAAEAMPALAAKATTTTAQQLRLERKNGFMVGVEVGVEDETIYVTRILV